MSLATYNNVLNLSTEIPNEIIPQSSNKLLDSTCKGTSITATGSNSCNGGGTLTFQLPSGAGAGWLKTKSVGLSLRITPTTAGAPHFAFPLGSAHSVINRLTISAGSQQLEQIQNYAQFAAICLSHLTNNDYALRDAAVLEGVGAVLATATPFTVILPLLSGILNADKYLPLSLMSAPLTITIDFNSDVVAFGTAAVTLCLYDQPKLLFDVVRPDSNYENSIRAQLASGKFFSIYYQSAMGAAASQAAAANLSFNSGVGLSSLMGVMAAPVLTAEMALATSQKPFTLNDATQYRWFVDGENYPQYPITLTATDQTQAFYNLQNLIGNVYDSNITSVCDRTTYANTYFVAGVGLRRSNSAGFTHTGVRASQVITEITGATAAANIYIYYLYSAELVIDASGGATSIR